MKALRIIGLVVAGLLLWFAPMVAGGMLGFWHHHAKKPPPTPGVVKMKLVYVDYVDPASSNRPTSVDPPQRAP